MCPICTEGRLFVEKLEVFKKQIHSNCVECHYQCDKAAHFSPADKEKLITMKKSIDEYQLHQNLDHHQFQFYRNQLNDLNENSCSVVQDFAAKQTLPLQNYSEPGDDFGAKTAANLVLVLM